MGLGSRAARALLVLVGAASIGVVVAAGQAAQRTVRDRVYTKEQAVRGGKQYAAICASCHDPTKVPAGKRPAPPVVGERFLVKWQDRTLGEFSTIIQTTMPNDGSVVLSDNETADVVAYLLQANGFPDGPSPLQLGATSKDIVIVK